MLNWLIAIYQALDEKLDITMLLVWEGVGLGLYSLLMLVIYFTVIR